MKTEQYLKKRVKELFQKHKVTTPDGRDLHDAFKLLFESRYRQTGTMGFALADVIVSYCPEASSEEHSLMAVHIVWNYLADSSREQVLDDLNRFYPHNPTEEELRRFVRYETQALKDQEELQ